MPRKFEKPTQFHLTPLDKEILPRCEHDIDLWSKGYFGGQMFPYQKYFYHAPQKRKTLIAGIRTGKSRLASRGALHHGQYNAYSRFLNTSISSEQSKIVFRNCLEDCNNANFTHWIEHIQSSPYPLIRLVNGSELHFRSIGYDAELIRGEEYDFINVDEAAYVVRESAIRTLSGRLLGINPITGRPRAGIMWLISSPKGVGWLFEQWKKGDPQYGIAEPHKYLSLRATIWDNPLLSEEQIRETMAEYSDAMIRQEFYGEFLDDLDAFFPYQQVMYGCDDTHREVKWLYDQIIFWNASREQTRTIRSDAGLTEDILWYECEPQPGHRYISSWDLGKKPTARGRNATVGLVLDITHEPWSMVGYKYIEGQGYVESKVDIERWHEKYSSNGALCTTVLDSTGKGDVLEEFIEREHTIDDMENVVYSSIVKPNLLHAGRIAIERGMVRYPFIKRLVDQMSQYNQFDKDIPQDIVMALCQALWKAREFTRISDTPERQVALNTALKYSSRSLVARRNPRFIESRMARRVARVSHGGNTRRGWTRAG